MLQWNLFYRNRRGAVLTTGGANYRRVRSAERAIADPRLANNVDGSPRFVSLARGDFRLRPGSKALHAGNPDPAFDDVAGGRNTIGHLGGPFASPSPTIP